MYEWNRLVTVEEQIKIYTFDTPFKSVVSVQRNARNERNGKTQG